MPQVYGIHFTQSFFFTRTMPRLIQRSHEVASAETHEEDKKKNKTQQCLITQVGENKQKSKNRSGVARRMKRIKVFGVFSLKKKGK